MASAVWRRQRRRAAFFLAQQAWRPGANIGPSLPSRSASRTCPATPATYPWLGPDDMKLAVQPSSPRACRQRSHFCHLRMRSRSHHLSYALIAVTLLLSGSLLGSRRTNPAQRCMVSTATATSAACLNRRSSAEGRRAAAEAVPAAARLTNLLSNQAWHSRSGRVTPGAAVLGRLALARLNRQHSPRSPARPAPPTHTWQGTATWQPSRAPSWQTLQPAPDQRPISGLGVPGTGQLHRGMYRWTSPYVQCRMAGRVPRPLPHATVQLASLTHHAPTPLRRLLHPQRCRASRMQPCRSPRLGPHVSVPLPLSLSNCPLLLPIPAHPPHSTPTHSLNSAATLPNTFPGPHLYGVLPGLHAGHLSRRHGPGLVLGPHLQLQVGTHRGTQAGR